MTDSLPHGDPLKPERDIKPGAEPLGTELESRLDEVESQNLGESGNSPDSPPPEPATDVPQGGGRAALPGEDEGPSGEGGQSLESAGGGGR